MNPHEPSKPGDAADAAGRQALSAFADGQADAADAACQAWRVDEGARRAWHRYHLIGDVLRSDELARPAAADADFLARLRERLADEPVVLVPEPDAAPAPVVPPRRSLRWLVPSAVAAGFVAVAGVLLVARMTAADLPAAGPQLSQAPAVSAVPVVTQAGAAMIRDRELDAYLEAHQAARGRGAVAVPGGMLRSAGVDVPASAAR